ncbi:unnamed protein product [Vitrella brassicaformis CCMP3155]|uniref:Uncharacterized protein n=1 Tax=Vitrella brassicaformis (strain CCMP3155) TaxID=1169540 RepID=A0A0G4EMN2_VITBC|nr:unnamed protein product [Vitrella brassicaformis CCMP3155]|eukprot:CEL98239.1 unnamed protein product [Vitrella brassicaformis CCMP3155]
MAHSAAQQPIGSKVCDLEAPQVSLATEKPKRITALKVLAVVGAIVLTAACVFGLMLAAIQLSKEITVSDDEQLVSRKDSMPLRFSEALDSVPLEGLAFLPLDEIQKMESLHINLGDRAPERVYNIEGVFRDLTTNTTELHLSLGHTLITKPGEFSLVDEKGAVIDSGEFEYEEAGDADDDESRRRLGLVMGGGGFRVGSRSRSRFSGGIFSRPSSRHIGRTGWGSRFSGRRGWF